MTQFPRVEASLMDRIKIAWTRFINILKIPFTRSSHESPLLEENHHKREINKEKGILRESSGEIECRRVAEMMTGKPFPKKRPDFLKNPVTSHNLEIDCFCEELKLGIEYNGKQHYKYTPYFHSSKDAFYNTRYRDEMKARLCKENGIKLIIVPYTVKVGDIEEYLKQNL